MRRSGRGRAAGTAPNATTSGIRARSAVAWSDSSAVASVIAAPMMPPSGPGAVERRQDRPAVAVLERHRLHVGAGVDHAEPDAVAGHAGDEDGRRSAPARAPAPLTATSSSPIRSSRALSLALGEALGHDRARAGEQDHHQQEAATARARERSQRSWKSGQPRGQADEDQPLGQEAGGGGRAGPRVAHGGIVAPGPAKPARMLFPEARRAVEAAAGETPVWTEGYDVDGGPRGRPGRGRAPSRARTSPRCATSTPTACRCRLYRPTATRPGRGRAPARRRLRLPRRRRARRRRAGGSPTGPGWRCSASTTGCAPEHRFPAAPDDVDTVLAWLDRDGAGSAGGPTYVHGDSAGGNLALVAALRHPGRFRARGADLPVPRPDAPASTSYRTGAPTASTRARRRGTGSSTPPRPADLTDPDLAPLLLRPARHAAADAGRHRRARPAARRGRAPGRAARRARASR